MFKARDRIMDRLNAAKKELAVKKEEFSKKEDAVLEKTEQVSSFQERGLGYAILEILSEDSYESEEAFARRNGLKDGIIPESPDLIKLQAKTSELQVATFMEEARTLHYQATVLEEEIKNLETRLDVDQQTIVQAIERSIARKHK
jgi:hypothetical protein